MSLVSFFYWAVFLDWCGICQFPQPNYSTRKNLFKVTTYFWESWFTSPMTYIVVEIFSILNAFSIPFHNNTSRCMTWRTVHTYYMQYHDVCHSWRNSFKRIESRLSGNLFWSTRPTTVPAGSDHYHRVSVRPKTSNQATITAGRDCGLAEWIIDDSCLVFPLFQAERMREKNFAKWNC